MTKLDLVQTVKGKCKITKPEAAEIVDLFFSEMANAFVKGERVEIRGLCSFSIKEYKPYTGRNPKLEKKFR